MQSFHQKLSHYLKKRDKENATNVVLQELASCLVKGRENFIHILRHAGVNVKDDASDVELIDTFVRNAPYNKSLLLGASYLINHSNKVSGFDGEDEVSDAGVKNTYAIMKSYFIGNDAVSDEEHSNWIGAVAGLAGQLLGGGKSKGGGGGAKESSASARAREAKARIEMQKKIEEIKRKEAEKTRIAKERAEKKTRNIIIIGGVVVSVLIIAIVIYAKNKNRK